MSIHEAGVGSDETLGVSSLLEMDLAILAEELVAALALKRLEWELFADDALDFFNHLSLKLVLNGVHLDVEGWNWLGAHELFHSPVGRDQVQSLIVGETILFAVHSLEHWVASLMMHIQLLDWHYIF